MAQILKRKSRVSDEIPTASMADIAFLLLIFFLVTTVFAEDRGLSLVLPEKATEISKKERMTSIKEKRPGSQPGPLFGSIRRIVTRWIDPI
ncbi:MAG: biopolymer transporter ExbD, partial [Gemmatimonadota bacterium]